MSAEHLILAGIFAFLFIAPLVWLFVFDTPRAVPPGADRVRTGEAPPEGSPIEGR